VEFAGVEVVGVELVVGVLAGAEFGVDAEVLFAAFCVVGDALESALSWDVSAAELGLREIVASCGVEAFASLAALGAVCVAACFATCVGAL
jgi:hypothetical protein